MTREPDKPRHGEIRQTACERVGDGYRIKYTLFLDPRNVYLMAPSTLPPHRKDNVK